MFSLAQHWGLNMLVGEVHVVGLTLQRHWFISHTLFQTVLMATGGGNWMWFIGCEWKNLIYSAASYVISKELCSIITFFFFSPVLHRVWQPCWSAVTVTRGFFCHSVRIFPKKYNWWHSSPVIKSADLCQWNRIATLRTVKESCLSWVAGLTSFFYGTTVW